MRVKPARVKKRCRETLYDTRWDRAPSARKSIWDSAASVKWSACIRERTRECEAERIVISESPKQWYCLLYTLFGSNRNVCWRCEERQKWYRWFCRETSSWREERHLQLATARADWGEKQKNTDGVLGVLCCSGSICRAIWLKSPCHIAMIWSNLRSCKCKCVLPWGEK